MVLISGGRSVWAPVCPEFTQRLHQRALSLVWPSEPWEFPRVFYIKFLYDLGHIFSHLISWCFICNINNTLCLLLVTDFYHHFIKPDYTSEKEKLYYNGTKRVNYYLKCDAYSSGSMCVHSISKYLWFNKLSRIWLWWTYYNQQSYHYFLSSFFPLIYQSGLRLEF